MTFTAVKAPMRGTVPYRFGLGFLFFFFVVGGIAHFAATATETSIVPPYVPHPRAAVLVSGVCELTGALGLLIQVTRRAALWGLFALVVAVTPCHVYMLQTASQWHVPYWVLVLRLPLQALLLGLIGWCALASRPRLA